MKVTVISTDKGGVGFYRCIAPAEEAYLLGVDVEVVYDVEAYIDEKDPMRVVEITEEADVYVIQRPMNRMWSTFIDAAHKQGSAVVIEIDDDLEMVHSKNLAHDGIHGNVSPDVGIKWFYDCIAKCDLVTVSSGALTKFAKNKSVVLRNYMPLDVFNVPLGAQEPSLGWAGSLQTHPTDLQATKGTIQKLMDTYDVPFSVVGDEEGVRRALGLRPDSRLRSTGWVDLEKYHFALAQAISVGIVPLDLGPFNQAKSALKGMEYAALGIPFVASPTAEYIRLEAYGVGKTAKTPGEWNRHLSRLLEDPDRAAKVGNTYRDIIKSEFTYRAHAHEWAIAWEQAFTYFKG